jgi:hypothetical protein
LKSGIRPVLAAFFALALVGVAACGSTSTASKTNPSQSTNSTPSADSGGGSTTGGGQLDPAVAMPSGFPADFPIYAGARLTTGTSFTSNGKTSWLMTWQTLDSFAKVAPYYTAQLTQGDWTTTYNSTSAGKWSAFFARKTDSSFGGTIVVDSTLKPGIAQIDIAMG